MSHGLGSSPFARRYSGNRCFFLFLRLLRCFSSPGSLHTAMDSLYSRWSPSSGVSPFRDLRVNGYFLLTAAFRSLSRLSSAPSAKASALCPCSLDLFEPVPGSCMGRLAYLPRSFSWIRIANISLAVKLKQFNSLLLTFPHAETHGCAVRSRALALSKIPSSLICGRAHICGCLLFPACLNAFADI